MMKIWWSSENHINFRVKRVLHVIMFGKKTLVDIIINLFKKFSFTPSPIPPTRYGSDLNFITW